MDLDKAYIWAASEQSQTKQQLKEKKLDLKDFYIRDDQHTAMFHESGTNTALVRFRRYSDGLLIYRLIGGYDQLRAEFPELVEMLLRTGVFVFQRATKGKRSQVVELNYLR